MKEAEIRPKSVFGEYLRLAALDGNAYFGNSIRIKIPCPACGNSGDFVFSKHGFDYEECAKCQALYVSPRPPAIDFYKYYQESPSANFFATTFYKETEAARREKLWSIKAQAIIDISKQFGAEKYQVIDIGGGYGVFAEEFFKLSGNSVLVIEPGPSLADICRKKGIDVVESFLEQVRSNDLPSGPKLFVSFELFEHLHDTNYFLSRLVGLMSPGDLFVFTTLSAMGLDIQALWSASNSISLQHLNFFNPKSIQILVNKSGLNVCAIETPGKLDLDILHNNKDLISDRFWRNFIAQSSSEDRDVWQKFIVSQKMSSHMLVVCQYPATD